MPWIKTIPRDEAEGELRDIYQTLYAMYPDEYRADIPTLRRADGNQDSIVAAHSLIPEAMRHIMAAHGVLIQPNLPLTRRQHEMIATVVSAQNECFY